MPPRRDDRFAALWRSALLCVLCVPCVSASTVLAGERFDRGLLWQVWKPGIAPSYVFGTLHLPDARLLPLPPPVRAALGRSRRYILELYPDEWVAARFVEAGQLDHGERLDGLLDPPAYEALAGLLAQRRFAREQVARMKPWAALLALTSAAAPEGEVTLDNALYIDARLANMRVEELDSVEEQVAVFDDLPREAQLALLRAYIADHARLPELAEQTMRAYLARDLAGLARLGRDFGARTPGLGRHQAMLEKKVIHDRSVVMAYRMQSYLRQGRSFVAVGALHLQGAPGLLSLLRDEYGWRVKRLW
jgi:uncharacterized protein YbaP (TraB family)